MTYVLNLKPETAKRIEERAAQSGTAPEQVAEELISSALGEARAERLHRLTNELFNERAGAYEVLAEGAK